MDQTEFINPGCQPADTKESEKGTNGQRWAIISLASIPLIMTLGNSMLIPVLPVMEKKLNISSLQSSLIITVYSIVAILLIPIAGYLSDRYGRKMIIIPSLIIAGLGGLIAGWASWSWANPYVFILMGRVLQGVGAAGAAPIVMPLVGDMFQDDRDVSSNLGIIETANTFGKVLSPILGAVLASFIWFLPFFSFPAFCLISTLLVLFLVKKPKSQSTGCTLANFIKNTGAIFKTHGRWLIAVFIIGVILMFILFGLLFFLSSKLESPYGYHGVKKGFILAIPLGFLCASSYTVGKIIKDDLVLMKRITFYSILLNGTSVGLLLFAEGLWVQMMLFVLSGIGIGASLPCLDAIITESIEKAERGTITSIYSSMRFVGVAAGPPITALMMKNHSAWIFITFAILSVFSLFFAGKKIKPAVKGTD
ncbi:MFS transporter [Falsibacillus albus]|uniref:MFS transporter n=1 Tax=Falsibacillus albus TaxID=2478915 RepID=A0A3L7JX85_9BACI|nr:MFS transporter [Falsibacillus albus]RLQ95366.1 MFS transporter [Falsibacillus albus]